jgi:preprotein translocase SecE subunit
MVVALFACETNPAETESVGSNETELESDTAGESESEKNAKKERLTRSIINLSVGALIVIAVVVLAIKFRSKIPTWWKGLKSECGKITWCPKDKLKKNTLVVVVIILAIAIAIGVLDFVFSRGMILLGDLFH